MYEPFIEKRSYLRTINENLGTIKKDTRHNISVNYKLNKKKVEFDKISNELILYNNPSKPIFKIRNKFK